MIFDKVSYPQFEADVLNTNEQMLNRWGCKNPSTIQKTWEEIKLPKRATKGSAGYDFFSPYEFELRPQKAILIPTGIKVSLDDDKFLAIYPRSGQGFKFKIQLFNTVGVIDSDFIKSNDGEGHIMAKLFNDFPVDDGKHTLVVKQGVAYCQGVIQQYFVVDDDDVTTERNGGFGSTG